ncbi:MAG: protein kinase, partial [Myxococcota bacterium]
MPISVFDPGTRERANTETRDVHVRGIYIHDLPLGTQAGAEVFVTFLGAPSQLPCKGTVQHIAESGAGIALHSVPNPSKRFIKSLTTLEQNLDGFHVTHHLGTGGMAQVYLAENPDDEVVVLKRLLPQFARESNAVELFTSEAELLSRCRHSGFPRFHTVRELDDVFFLAMEWIRGISLDQVLQRPQQLQHDRTRSGDRQSANGVEHLVKGDASDPLHGK